MVAPIPPYLSPERLEYLQQLADASRLRTALFTSPTPPPLTAVPRWPAEPVAHRAPPSAPPRMNLGGAVRTTRSMR